LLLQQDTEASLLVNYGGDMYVNKPRQDGQGWFVGIEDPELDLANNNPPANRTAVKQYELSSGGIATSGDAKRYLIKNGIRYGHILDPKTGWPVIGAPHSVTVAAGTCTEAGILATLAMLKGEHAEEFLQQQDVTYWCIR
jgi:thiamine biosynthesis lipoprotein